LINGYWFEILPKDYIVESLGACLLAIGASPLDYFILGAAFLQGYYSIHDMTEDRIGFAPHSTSTKNPL
jgi:Eukaryotic aspartyl protease